MWVFLSRTGSVVDDGDDDGQGCKEQADECKVEHGRHGVGSFQRTGWRAARLRRARPAQGRARGSKVAVVITHSC